MIKNVKLNLNDIPGPRCEEENAHCACRRDAQSAFENIGEGNKARNPGFFQQT